MGGRHHHLRGVTARHAGRRQMREWIPDTSEERPATDPSADLRDVPDPPTQANSSAPVPALPDVSDNGRRLGPLAIADQRARDARWARVWAKIDSIDRPSATIDVRTPEERAHPDSPRPDPQRPPVGAGPDGSDTGAGAVAAWHPKPAGARTLVDVVRTRRRILFRVVVLGIFLAAALSLSREPLYESRASVLVRPVHVLAAAGEARPEPLISLSTEREVMRSGLVAQRVQQRLGSLTVSQLLSRVTVEVTDGTPVLTVAFRDPYPARARDGAQAFVEAYLEQRRHDAEQVRAAQTAEIQAAIEVARTQRADKELRAARIEELNRQFAVVTAISTDPGEVIDPATMTTTPVAPSHARNLALGAVIGALLGAGAAFIRDHRDDRILDAAEVERRLGVPVLARLRSKRLSGHSDARVTVLDDPAGPTAEGFRRLRAQLPDRARSLLVTSAGSGEGKGLVATNLAVTYAKAGRRVLLVSVDLHSPAVHWLLRLANDRGLSSVLAGTARIGDVAQRVAIVPLLDVVPSGPAPDDPGDLLQPDRLQPLLRRLGHHYDVVVLDAPPIMSMADALGLCRGVDGVLLTGVLCRTRRHDLARVVGEVHKAGGRLLGTALLEVDEEACEPTPQRRNLRRLLGGGRHSPSRPVGSQPGA